MKDTVPTSTTSKENWTVKLFVKRDKIEND